MVGVLSCKTLLRLAFFDEFFFFLLSLGECAKDGREGGMSCLCIYKTLATLSQSYDLTLLFLFLLFCFDSL